MRDTYLFIRSLVLWGLTLPHFAFFTLLLLLMRRACSPRTVDAMLRFWLRNIQRLAGVRVRYDISPGFDGQRTSFFVCNHVNLFDPFVVYNGFPQPARGVELESHFNIPVYGALMSQFGNVPVPDERSASGIKKMFRLTKESLESGMSLVVFPEGARTLTGRLGPFEDGAFMLAQKFKYPIVPISIVGSFEFKRKGNWLLHPATITVHIHDTIDTSNIARKDITVLRDKVWQIIAEPVHAHADAVEARRPVE